MKHTKGPWSIRKTKFNDDGMYSHDIYLQKSLSHLKMIAHIYKYDESEANARLIAEAPAMLEALEMLMDRLNYHGTIDVIREEGPIADVRAIISRIEGSE
jgi:hypothetical protein